MLPCSISTIKGSFFLVWPLSQTCIWYLSLLIRDRINIVVKLRNRSTRAAMDYVAEACPKGATLGPRSVAAAKRSSPMSKEQCLHGCRRAERSYSTFKIRRGDLVQGKELWLCFAGAAMKRYPTSKLGETQVRR